MSDSRRRHVVVSAPSQWGQQACEHLLHRSVANSGRVTLIVPRREQARFKRPRPSLKDGRSLPSLERWLEDQRASGRPIDFVYDDQCNHLAAVLISQRSSKTHLTVGYVTSSADEHLNHARYLSQFCERVLVEKPISRVYSEIVPGGGFPLLAQELEKVPAERMCELRTAEHYLFRPGVTEARESLKKFVARHKRCNLHYEFCFEEPAGRDDPAQRPGAYQDGAILDVLAPHGFGPVAGLLLPMLKIQPEHIDFYRNLTWTEVESWQAAVHRSGPLKVPVLAETAARLQGKLKLTSGRTLHFKLRSAKGCERYMRFFKLSCPVAECRQPLSEDEKRTLRSHHAGAGSEHYVGVSLGSAGFTVFDPGDPASHRAQDGGFESDNRGSISEGANAQAAMLDALLGDKFKRDKRFIRVETACQLVRAGLRAQGIAFNHGGHEPYTWGKGPKRFDGDQAGSAATRDGRAMPAERQAPPTEHRPLRTLSPGVTLLREVLGVVNGPAARVPYHRIVTILGSEGTGNSDVARSLSSELGALRIDIPRDEAWELQGCAQPVPPPPSPFTLEMVLRNLAERLDLPLTTARRPAEELPHYLATAGLKGSSILLFNGVDRLQRDDWQALVRILNLLTAGFRMIFVTKTWDRAAGFVVRTEEMVRGLPAVKKLKKPAPEVYLPPHLAESPMAVDEYRWLRDEVLIPFSRDNITVLQQVASYVFYIALPAAFAKTAPDPAHRYLGLSESSRALVRKHIQDELASLDVPKPLTANPEDFLDRVSRLSLAMVGEARREAVRTLAAVSGEIPRALIEEALPGLFAELVERRPVRALFETVIEDRGALLFPRVRHAVLTCGPEDLTKLRVEIEHRRLLLALRRLRPDGAGTEARREHEVQMIRLFYGASLDSLNLDDSAFEAWCMERIEGLESSSDLHGDQAAGSLIELLTDESSPSKTNLGLLGRARLTRLKGWLMRSAAGTNPALLHEVGKTLDHAVALARYRVERTPRSAEQRRQELETLVLAFQGRVYAGLVQSRLWHRLFHVGTVAPIDPQPWEVLVTWNTGETRNLWQLCGVEPTGNSRPKANVSRKVLGIALRTLALYTAYTVVQAQRSAAPCVSLEAARLCLWAASHHSARAADCRARNLLEAALLLPPHAELDDLWGLDSGRSITGDSLRAMAKKLFAPLRDGHPGLAPYLDLLDLRLAARANNGPLDCQQVEQLERAFERTGEKYFSQLMRDMMGRRKGPDTARFA
jgi:hypothetical protein